MAAREQRWQQGEPIGYSTAVDLSLPFAFTWPGAATRWQLSSAARRRTLQHRSPTFFKTCLAHDFVGLNRGSSLLELTSRAAEQAGMPMRLRVQVRSFEATLLIRHLIASGASWQVADQAPDGKN